MEDQNQAAYLTSGLAECSPHLCCCHDKLSVVVSFGLHQVYVDPGNHQGNFELLDQYNNPDVDSAFPLIFEEIVQHFLLHSRIKIKLQFSTVFFDSKEVVPFLNILFCFWAAFFLFTGSNLGVIFRGLSLKHFQNI